MPESLGDLVHRLITRRLQSEAWGSAGTILAYDPARHTAKARLHPDERDTGWLPLLTLPGVVLAPAPGAPCYVHLQRGVPAMIAGVAYSDQPVYPHLPPAPGLALDQHSVSVQTLSVGGPLTLTPRATLPTPTARGQMALLGPAYNSASGDVPDTLWVTVQDAAGALAWRQVLTTPQLGQPLFAASLDAGSRLTATQARGVRQLIFLTQTTDITAAATTPTAWPGTWSATASITTNGGSKVRVRLNIYGVCSANLNLRCYIVINSVTYNLGGMTWVNPNYGHFAGVIETATLAASTYPVALQYDVNTGTATVNANTDPTHHRAVLEIEEVA